MKYIDTKNFIIITAYIILIFSCRGTTNDSGYNYDHNHNKEEQEEHSHNHEDEVPDLSYTIFVDDYELFIEFPPLVVGEKTKMLIHFTDLKTYKPIKSSVMDLYTENDKSNIIKVKRPLKTGIYSPIYTPNKEGKTNLIINLFTEGKELTFVIKDIDIFNNKHDAFHVKTAKHDGISYLKETSWYSDFAIEKTTKIEFDELIKCAGEIISDSKGEVSVVAPVSGIFTYFDRNIIPGKKINKGDIIGSISGGDIDDNIRNKFSKAKADFEEAEDNYKRAKELIQENIISQKQFITTKSQYTKAKSEYELISQNYGKSGRLIYSPISGVVSDLSVKGNTAVNGGDNIIIILNNQNYMLKANLPKSYYNSFNNIYDANFKAEYSDKVFSISELGGKRIQSGYTGKIGTAYIPIYFNIPYNEEIIIGSFAKVYLKSNNKKEIIAVPVSSIMESNGNYFVYVQITGELFEERYVTLGKNDGYRVEIIKGLEEGEYVITKGTYKVKQASMSNAIPEHTH